jgi:hypothetical protein
MAVLQMKGENKLFSPFILFSPFPVKIFAHLYYLL